MKVKHIVTVTLVCIIISILVGCDRSNPQGDNQNSQEISAEMEKTLLKLEKLTEEVDDLKAELKTVKLTDKDYSKEIQEMVRKQVQQMPAAEHSGAGLKVAVVSIRRKAPSTGRKL
jgi:uncharacterized protein YlxW (UPF0749 family)